MNVCIISFHDLGLHLHMLVLSHVSLLVLGYHGELLPLLLNIQSSANHTPCEVDLSGLVHES